MVLRRRVARGVRTHFDSSSSTRVVFHTKAAYQAKFFASKQDVYQVGLIPKQTYTEVALYIGRRYIEVSVSNYGRSSGCPDWGVLQIFSVPSGKCREGILIRLWPLPSKSFRIDRSFYHWMSYRADTDGGVEYPLESILRRNVEYLDPLPRPQYTPTWRNTSYASSR
jgi:hypothetical protein